MARERAAGPTRDEVLRFIQGAGQGLRRRELIEALAPERGQRVAVKEILRDLANDGEIGRRRLSRPNPEAAEVPRVTVLDVIAIDDNGDLRLGHPERPELVIILPAESLQGAGPSPAVGDRVLARLRPGEPGEPIEARDIKLLPLQGRAVVVVL
jgi:ribonuclease R